MPNWLEVKMKSAECDLVSPRQLAKSSGWPERRIRGLIAQNQIRHLRVGSSILVPVDAIEEFVRTNMVNPNSAGNEGQIDG
jgi:excisionase family DNA binding protein